VLGDVHEQRVPAACEQAEKGRLERLRLEIQRGHVAVQVVDGDERQPAAPGKRFRGREPDEQRADQARALRDRDRVDVVERMLAERLLDHRHDQLEVPAGGDLGDDASEACMQVRLRRDDVRDDAAVVDQGCRGLVATGFQSEDQDCVAGSETGSFHMISASSRLSV
jgi:hypothetical protein